jgi:hypothetical protein
MQKSFMNSSRDCLNWILTKDGYCNKADDNDQIDAQEDEKS